jgi:hypothetical protein
LLIDAFNINTINFFMTDAGNRKTDFLFQ